MDKGKKILYVILIVGFVIGNYIILAFIWPAIQDMIGVATADPVLSGNHASDFAYYNSFVKAMPFWLYFLPAVVGVIEAIIVLKTGERLIDRG